MIADGPEAEATFRGHAEKELGINAELVSSSWNLYTRMREAIEPMDDLPHASEDRRGSAREDNVHRVNAEIIQITQVLALWCKLRVGNLSEMAPNSRVPLGFLLKTW